MCFRLIKVNYSIKNSDHQIDFMINFSYLTSYTVFVINLESINRNAQVLRPGN